MLGNYLLCFHLQSKYAQTSSAIIAPQHPASAYKPLKSIVIPHPHDVA